MTEILGIDTYRSNAELIEALVTLGYLSTDTLTLDCTYGLGTFWKNWRPATLMRHDLNPAKAPDGPMDFRDLQYPDGRFEAVVLDADYKLNGTPTPEVDGRYGADEVKTWQQRNADIITGMTEAHRVLRPRGRLFVKCMDQVSSGKVRWQTLDFANHGLGLGMELEDRLDMVSHRKQPTHNPDGSVRRQVHARRNASTMLVFRKARK